MAERKIKNFDVLAVNESRRKALTILEAGLEAIDTTQAIKSSISLKGNLLKIQETVFALNDFKRLLFVGVGKCALEAGGAIEDILVEKLTGGIVLDVHQGRLKKIKTFGGTHPLPSEENEKATKAIINLFQGVTEKDLVLFVVSGGASTLLCQPQNMTCFEEGKIFDYLTHRGATIKEINTVRKHLSLARGGYLAKYAYPAQVVSLIFSDVIGNDLEFIASGPTVKDTTTVNDAEAVIRRFQVARAIGFDVRSLIETPKEDKYFEKVNNILLVSNQTALQAMIQKSEALGFSSSRICTDRLAGEARAVGETIVRELDNSPDNAVLLYGGETTVVISGSGRGGRNQELALSALRFFTDNELVIAVDSDGLDNGPHAGAICDKITKEKARGLDPNGFLAKNDSYDFFEKIGDYVMTGDTGSNVADIILAMKE